MRNNNETSEDGKITFYYNREARLKRASQNVQDINDPSKLPKRGLLRALTATTPLKIMFFSIVVFCVFMFILSRIMSRDPVKVLGNNTISITAIAAGDSSYLSLKKTAGAEQGEIYYTGELAVLVTLPMEESPVHIEWINFSPDPEQVFQFSVPFSGNKLLVFMEAHDERIMLEIRPRN